MKLDLNEIAHSLGMHYTYEVDDQPDFSGSGVTVQGPVTGKLVFSNTGGLIVVRGDLKARVELECVRCLENYESDYDVDVSEQFKIHVGTWQPAYSDELVDESPEEDETGLPDDIFKEGLLDLTELIRQNLLVILPLAPLCDEECKGICPGCGANRNRAACNCPQEEQAPSGSRLAELLAGWQDQQNNK